jgi:hypothetical protein
MVASIEYIENVIATYEQAAEANLKTPGRDGNVIFLSAESAEEVMITGDLHGHRRNFNSIRKVANLDRKARRHLILQEVCHGGPTYSTNGGCMSHSLLEDVAKLKVQYPDRVHFLLGNHELAELTDYPIQKNKQMLNLLFRLGLQEMYGPATEKVREAYFAFIRTCPLAVRLGKVFISHSLPESVDTRRFDQTVLHRELQSEDFLERTPVFDLVWGRDYRQENAKAFAELVRADVLINGHEPCPEGQQTPNDYQIILDCCGDKACYVVLPTDEELTQAQIVSRIRQLR